VFGIDPSTLMDPPAPLGLRRDGDYDLRAQLDLIEAKLDEILGLMRAGGGEGDLSEGAESDFELPGPLEGGEIERRIQASSTSGEAPGRPESALREGPSAEAHDGRDEVERGGLARGEGLRLRCHQGAALEGRLRIERLRMTMVG
jgi:hypothetical protein